MAETILQSYLNNQFIKTTEEGNVANLKKAVTEVLRLLKKRKTKLIEYTLVAIDPYIPENDPVISEVERIIIKKWPAFKNNVTATNDKATTYIRAVILETLNKLAKEDQFAPIIWLTSRNLIKYCNLGNERNVVYELFQTFADETEKKGQDIWSLTKQVEMPNISIPDVKIDTSLVSKNHLIKTLKSASGPSSIKNGTNTANEEPKNRYWPNQSQHWATDFGDIAGNAIATSINEALKIQNNSIASINNQINNSLKDLNPYFEQIGNVMLQSAEATNKRSQLLWWKETLYSSVLSKSYRKLSPITTAMVMAVDLSNMITTVYPESVNYLLKESLKIVHGEYVDEENKIGDFVKQLTELGENEKSLLQKLYNKQEGRKSLGSAIANKLAEDRTDLYIDIGVDSDAKITLADFCVWLFHDLQAKKLVSIK